MIVEEGAEMDEKKETAWPELVLKAPKGNEAERKAAAKDREAGAAKDSKEPEKRSYGAGIDPSHPSTGTVRRAHAQTR